MHKYMIQLYAAYRNKDFVVSKIEIEKYLEYYNNKYKGKAHAFARKLQSFTFIQIEISVDCMIFELADYCIEIESFLLGNNITIPKFIIASNEE